MTSTMRGADLAMRALESAGASRVFTLSGNHIMSLFDAALETGLDLVHVRQEAAAVHMADAWGRLTGAPGVAMVTGGPGHANAVPALFTARGQDSPLVLLSGHGATTEIGRGGFQELAQAAMAAPLAKASFTATRTETIGEDIARAFRIARAGRPGPVHLSLPSDLLDARAEVSLPRAEDFLAPSVVLADSAADAVLSLIAAAEHPLLIAGPVFASREGRTLLDRLARATGMPAVVSESPRGIADATLGAFAAVLARADLILLLAKPLDFTLKFGDLPGPAGRRFAMIDPEGTILDRAAREKAARLAFACLADPFPAAEALIARAAAHPAPRGAWRAEAEALIHRRPESWANLRGSRPGKLHPSQVFRTLAPIVAADPDTVLICDGGEFAQWGQSLLAAPRRLINGVGGSIGGSIPFALAARCAEPRAPVFAVLGDGTFGFHMAEFETAVRRALPFVAVVGTDARWNAEYNLQLRDYGANRARGCDLTETRYDLVVAALGGHGELVERIEDLPGAIERALASGKPACVNVMIDPIAAPVVRGEANG
ncbi:MAG: thiamine pyrophosphate-binding protein [Rhodospirillales bacterium]|nr:thiamine pyrophosphate-binding protein [Rhodospirillales bacterium]